MNCFFRFDYSLKIGGGHGVRCVNLAKSLAEKFNVIFLSRNDLPRSLFEEQSWEVVSVPWSGDEFYPDQVSDGSFCKDLIREGDLIVVDHYGLDSTWEQALVKKGGRIVVIDDLANRRHDSEILIDYNYLKDIHRYVDLIPSECKTLLGTEYCILSQDFTEGIDRDYGEIKKIMIFFGSFDNENLCEHVFNVLNENLDRGIEFDIIVGGNSPFNEQLVSLEKKNQNLTVHIQTKDIKGIMSRADLYVGSGGTVTWERCAMGLPSLVFSVAENQVEGCRALHEEGIIQYLGPSNDQTQLNMVPDKVRSLSESDLRSMGEKSLKCVDGEGTQRVCDELLKLCRT